MTVRFAAEQTVYDSDLDAGIRLAMVEADQSELESISDVSTLITDPRAGEAIRIPELDEESLITLVSLLADPRHSSLSYSRMQFIEITDAVANGALGDLAINLSPEVREFAKQVVYGEYMPVLGSPWKGASTAATLLGGVAGFVALGPVGALTFFGVIGGGIVILRVANGLGEGLEGLFKRMIDEVGPEAKTPATSNR